MAIRPDELNDPKFTELLGAAPRILDPTKATTRLCRPAAVSGGPSQVVVPPQQYADTRGFTDHLFAACSTRRHAPSPSASRTISGRGAPNSLRLHERRPEAAPPESRPAPAEEVPPR